MLSRKVFEGGVERSIIRTLLMSDVCSMRTLREVRTFEGRGGGLEFQEDGEGVGFPFEEVGVGRWGQDPGGR